MRSETACAVLAAAVLMPAAALPASASPIARDEALRAAFPEAEITAERVFLTPAEQQEAARLAGVDVPSALVARYVARRAGRVVGRAYVDTHVVRTKRESLLVSVSPDGRVLRVDVTALLEPPEYEAPGPWLNQYRERPLGADLQVDRAIRPIAGATLTARAVNDAVRRVLAIDRVLAGGDAP